jgi:hypothetical protein
MIYINELLDPLFFRDCEKLQRKYEELTVKYFPDGRAQATDGEAYTREFDAFLLGEIPGSAEFYNRVNDYAQNGNLDYGSCSELTRDGCFSASKYGSPESGKGRADAFDRMSWLNPHISKYVESINSDGHTMILELGTGAGLGTYHIMKSLKPDSRLISADIEFAAARNADGLAAHMGMSDRVFGINANFWRLPFADGTFDVICTHYGLDECGELPRVLREVSRTLRNSGKFIVVCRESPFVRHAKNFSLWNIPPDEHREICRKLRIYSGPDDLFELAAAVSLRLTCSETITPEQGHTRVFAEFAKLP